jgi:hypothetical protein
MTAKLTTLTHKIAIQLNLVAVAFVVLAPVGQSGNFWIHPLVIVSSASFNSVSFTLCEGVYWMYLAQDTGSCEHGIEPSGAIKVGGGGY